MTGIRFIFGQLKTRPLYHELLIRTTKAFTQSSDQFLKTQSDIFNTYNNDIVSFQFFSSSAEVLPNVSNIFFCLKVTTLTSTFHSQKNNHIKLMSTLHTILLYLYCSLLHWGSFTFLLQIRNVIHPKQYWSVEIKQLL